VYDVVTSVATFLGAFLFFLFSCFLAERNMRERGREREMILFQFQFVSLHLRLNLISDLSIDHAARVALMIYT